MKFNAVKHRTKQQTRDDEDDALIGEALASSWPVTSLLECVVERRLRSENRVIRSIISP